MFQIPEDPLILADRVTGFQNSMIWWQSRRQAWAHPSFRRTVVSIPFGPISEANVAKFAVLYSDLSQVTAAQCVLLLENVRFHKGETKNDPAFAEKVSKPRSSNMRAIFH